MGTKSYIAKIDIPAYSLVAFGQNDKEVTMATDATTLTIGVTGDVDVTQGNMADVTHLGDTEIKAGATIARGEAFTAKNGKAIKAQAGDIIAGYALRDAVADQVFYGVICRGQVPNASSTPQT